MPENFTLFGLKIFTDGSPKKEVANPLECLVRELREYDIFWVGMGVIN